MKKYLLLAFISFSFLITFAQGKDEMAIRNALATQQQAWNNGDIPKFMETYWHSDSLMFTGKSGITYGWDNTLKNYQKGYPDTATMGKLDFTILHVKRLSAIYFTVIGKWHLSRSKGDVGGYFTLLFRKIKNRWLIVSDHTS
jgi:ketosteroid isomerase-like protein